VAAAGTGSSFLKVERFRAQYLVSSDHPSPERVKARLDETVTKSLAGTLSAIVSRWFSPTDSSIWLIRRLELDVDVNAAWEWEQVARRWATQIARELAATLQAGEDGQNVLCFPDRAAYLARFLVDLADGRAWSKWYYKAFDGLRMLPASAALRTAICDQPATGLSALLQLTAHQRASMLPKLTVQDARRVLDSIASHTLAGDEMGCFQALWAAWKAADLGPLQAGEEWRNALRLYLGVCDGNAKLSGPTLRSAALALLRLARCLASGSASQSKELIAALTAGDLPALYIAAGIADAETMAPLLRCPPEWVKKVGQALLSRDGGQMALEPAAATAMRYTPFGGIFLLLPFLDALPLERATHDWPDAEDTTAVAMLRFLILVKCCGGAWAQRVFFDPLVRDLVGIDPALSPAVVARWQACVSRANLETFLEEISAWQRESGAVSGQMLVFARAPMPGAAAAVLLDGQRGVWLYATGYHPHRLSRLIERLRPWLSPIEGEAALLISEDVFVDALRTAFPHITLTGRHSHSVTRMAEEDNVLAGILARLDKLSGDLAYLSLPKLFHMSRSVDLALSVVAQGVMRDFAWRLPGFAASSLPYLYRNFLDFAGRVEEEPDRRVVRLGRPPLNLVLNITGMARRTYGLSWLDERPIVLFQEG